VKWKSATTAAVQALAVVLLAGIAVTGSPLPSAADTPAGTVYGEGGAAVNPIMIKLLQQDSPNLAPDFGSYTNVDNDTGIADFVGTAANTFAADYAVTERPLTTAEAAKASADGRSFAYVPFAAAPVAIVTLVPNDLYTGNTDISPSEYCQHIPLTMVELADIYGFNSTTPMTNWADPRLECTSTGGTPDSVPITRWGNLDPTMENFALMTALDSTPTTEALYQAGLNNAFSSETGLTTNADPSEVWPYSKPSIPGGDEAVLGHMIGINSKTNAPSILAADIALGGTVPVSSDWTAAPLGAAWNLPTAAIQNAQGSFVSPSAASAAAAEADATLASTSDPTTNNLVTYVANATDAAAYNNYLMLQSYLVVPTNGLPADKATALAQFIRFVLGGAGQQDIASFGAAPATPAMVAAGLKVAQELNNEAALDADDTTASTTTTTTAGTASSSASTTTTSPTAVQSSASGMSGNSGSATTSASSLAVTGSNPLPLAMAGASFAILGEMARRRVRRRKARA
jgi:hypothetical protein